MLLSRATCTVKGTAQAPPYFVNVRGRGSNYCLNIRGTHSQDCIWFQYTKQGIMQCCNVCEGYKPEAKMVTLANCAKLQLGMDIPRRDSSDLYSRIAYQDMVRLDARRNGLPEPGLGEGKKRGRT